jgi:hypothetical protein
MKIKAPGETPMERLTNLTKQIIVVTKTEVEHAEKQWRSRKRKHRKRQ